MPIAWEPTAAGLMQLLDDYGDDRVGIVYDVAHGWFIGEDMASALRAVGKRLRLVQVADTDRRVCRHDAIGQGSIAFAGLPPLLAEIGYGDWPVLEIHTRDPDRGIATSIAALLEAGFGNPPLMR